MQPMARKSAKQRVLGEKISKGKCRKKAVCFLRSIMKSRNINIT